MKHRERTEECCVFVCVVCVVFVEVKKKKQTLFSLQTADLWSTSSHADACRCGPQTTDLLHLKKQTAPK
ncbi:hypothetical protein HanRHA438_Chr10g0464171 [Helianthus annuus]|nr:hypothetical protein HanRHA438_Chr10g0464171 [Helianthus annuus]